MADITNKKKKKFKKLDNGCLGVDHYLNGELVATQQYTKDEIKQHKQKKQDELQEWSEYEQKAIEQGVIVD